MKHKQIGFLCQSLVKMEKSFVSVNGTPAKLITLGQRVDDKPKNVVLIFPGNPGLASYYEDFMAALKSKLPEDYSVWTLGHAGHDLLDGSHVSDLNLQDTIKQKVDFVQDHFDVDEQNVILIGHSIGAKMVLEVMRKHPKIAFGCLLFPTVENMITSPAGKRLKHSVRYVPAMIQMALAWILSFLPSSFLSKLIKFWLKLSRSGTQTSQACVEATVDLIHPRVIGNILYLAKTELETVLDPDYELINELKDRLWFYYGAEDPWVPLSYYNNLKENVPGVNAQVCQQNIAHAFVLSSSSQMANIVSSEIKSRSEVQKLRK